MAGEAIVCGGGARLITHIIAGGANDGARAIRDPDVGLCCRGWFSLWRRFHGDGDGIGGQRWFPDEISARSTFECCGDISPDGYSIGCAGQLVLTNHDVYSPKGPSLHHKNLGLYKLHNPDRVVGYAFRRYVTTGNTSCAYTSGIVYQCPGPGYFASFPEEVQLCGQPGLSTALDIGWIEILLERPGHEPDFSAIGGVIKAINYLRNNETVVTIRTGISMAASGIGVIPVGGGRISPWVENLSINDYDTRTNIDYPFINLWASSEAGDDSHIVAEGCPPPVNACEETNLGEGKFLLRIWNS